VGKERGGGCRAGTVCGRNSESCHFSPEGPHSFSRPWATPPENVRPPPPWQAQGASAGAAENSNFKLRNCLRAHSKRYFGRPRRSACRFSLAHMAAPSQPDRSRRSAAPYDRPTVRQFDYGIVEHLELELSWLQSNNSCPAVVYMLVVRKSHHLEEPRTALYKVEMRPASRLCVRLCHSQAALVDVAAARSELQAFTRAASPADRSWLRGELASDHAGEAGAVSIYRGAASALALLRPGDTQAFDFVRGHLDAEEQHLALFEALLPPSGRSSLTPMWRLAGFALGFAPTALGGSTGLYVTVAAVEAFVEEHYAQQTNSKALRDSCPSLVALLEHCAAEETHHKEDAASRAGLAVQSVTARAWAVVVDGGSRAAVAMARRV